MPNAKRKTRVSLGRTLSHGRDRFRDCSICLAFPGGEDSANGQFRRQDDNNKIRRDVAGSALASAEDTASNAAIVLGHESLGRPVQVGTETQSHRGGPPLGVTGGMLDDVRDIDQTSFGLSVGNWTGILLPAIRPQ